MCYPALAWSIQLLAYAMLSVPVPPIVLLTWGFSGGGARMPARSVCLVTLSLSEAGPGRFGRQASVTDIYHAMPPCHSTSMVDSVTGLRHAECSRAPDHALLTDMVPRCRLLAVHGPTPCLSVRTQPLTATGAPSQTSTTPCHAMLVRLHRPLPCHAMPCHASCHGVLPSMQPGRRESISRPTSFSSVQFATSGRVALACRGHGDLLGDRLISDDPLHGGAWHGMTEICEGASVAVMAWHGMVEVSDWVLTDGHDLGPCAANGLHRGTTSVSNMIGGTGTLSIAQASN